MSRSTTYTPVQLSLEEIARRQQEARRQRVQSHVLPHLRASMLERMSTLESTTANMPDRSTVLACETIAELEQIAIEINTPAGTTGQTTLSETQEPLPEFERVRLRAELQSLAEVASETQVEVPEIRTLMAELDQPSATANFDMLSSQITAIEDQLDTLRNQLEVQARLEQISRQALVDMGYRVSITPEGILHGIADDQRTATIDLHSGLECEFTDVASAVEPEDSNADQICEPAIRDRANLQLRIQADPDLVTGPIEVDEPPIRGRAREAKTTPFTNCTSGTEASKGQAR